MATAYCDGVGNAFVNCGLTLDKWLNAILVRTPGITTATARCELQAAVHDWYHRSVSWREEIGPYDIRDGNTYVWLNPVDAYANAHHVLGARLVDANGASFELRRSQRPLPAAHSGRPEAYYCIEPYSLQIYPIPDQDYLGKLYVYCALMPVDGTERLPEIAATHHFEGILAGALARVYAIPFKPWTNLELAAYYEREYRRRIMTARDEANRGHTQIDTIVRFPFFA